MSGQSSRKFAIITLLGLPLAAAEVMAVQTGISAQQIPPSKPYLDPKDVGYIPKSKINGKMCSKCAYFLRPDKCAFVKGVIAPEGYCNKFRHAEHLGPRPRPLPHTE